jgi:hypothetical protein
VLSHVRERFLNNPDDDATNRWLNIQISGVRDELGPNACFALEPVGDLHEMGAQSLGVYIQGFYLLHQLAQLPCLLQQDFLYFTKLLRSRTFL